MKELLNYQYMINSELLANPVLTESTSQIYPYFPKGSWYDFVTGLEI